MTLRRQARVSLENGREKPDGIQEADAANLLNDFGVGDFTAGMACRKLACLGYLANVA